MKKIIFLLFLCSSAVLCNAAQSQNIKLGIWVWSQKAYKTATEREKLLSFCADEKISHLDQYFKFKKSASGLSLENAEALKNLIIEAHEQGVTVNALQGDRALFFEKNHEKALNALRSIIAFDKQLPEGVHLSGVKYDVEPYLTKEWKEGEVQQNKIMQDYLSFLSKANELVSAEASHLSLSVDAPFWWDKQELTVDFEGNEKQFIKHILDQTDYLTIMSYRQSSKAVLNCVEEELAYAQEIGKSICPALETIKLTGNESKITFHGKPSEDFRKTVEELQQTLSGSNSVKYIMIHYYGSLVPYLKSDPNKSAEQ